MNKKMNKDKKIFRQAIEHFYEKNGVGKTYFKKKKYWESLYPDTFIIYCKADSDWVKEYEFYWFNNEGWTEAYETNWVSESYPDDAQLSIIFSILTVE